MSSKTSKTGKTRMTRTDASRIASATAKGNGGSIPAGSFASRAQRAASSDQPGNWPSKNEGMPSGGSRTNNPPRRK